MDLEKKYRVDAQKAEKAKEANAVSGSMASATDMTGAVPAAMGNNTFENSQDIQSEIAVNPEVKKANKKSAQKKSN